MAKTRANLIESIARRYGRYTSGTATSGSTSTIVTQSALWEPDDFWVNHFAYIVTDAGGGGAAPQGEERAVTDFEQSSGTLTVSPVFSAAVAVGDTFEVLPVRRADLAEAINSGIREMGETWLVSTVDTTTITLAADDYDYTVPTGLVRLLRVKYRDSSDEPWKDLPGALWEVAGTPGAQELLLTRGDMVNAGDNLRLEYLARVAEMASDAATLGLGAPAEREAVNFIIEKALAWLYRREAKDGNTRVLLTLAMDADKAAAEWQAKATPPEGAQTGTARGVRFSRTHC